MFPEQGTPAGRVTGVILAGGQSRRMGSNKALLPYRGGRLIVAIYRQLAALCDDMLVVTNTPEHYAFLNCRMAPDIHLGQGVLAGLHSGLVNCRTEHIFAVACDMPYLSDTLIRALIAQRHDSDVVIAEGEFGLEPLHAVYSRACLAPIETALLGGKKRLVSFFPEVQVKRVPLREVRTLDPLLDSFRNINTPEDYYELRDGERAAIGAVPDDSLAQELGHVAAN